MSALRPIKALNFPDTEPGPVGATEPRLAVIDPTALLVDDAYQRNLSQKSVKLIRRIVGEWSWRAFKPPVVVQTDEGLHVIDGQHTAIAAATHPDVRQIPVLIVEADTRQARADAFVRHNRDRIAITGTQLHHSMVAAGDADAVTIQQVCERAGARVLRNPPGGGTWGIGDTIAIEALRALVHRRYAMGAREVLEVCVAGKCAPISAGFLRAVEHLLHSDEFTGQVEPADIATTIRAMGEVAEREGAMFAAQYRIPKWRGLAAVLFRNTKKGRGHGRRAAA